MNYKNANKCHRCPQTNTEKGCPHWMEVIMENAMDGEIKTEKACGHILMPKLLVMAFAASNRSTEEINKVANNIQNGFDKLSLNIQQINSEPLTRLT